MVSFARRTDRVSLSGIREVFEAAGPDAINLGLGQPDFPAPDHVHRAATEAIEAGAADAYTENRGTQGLRAAIREKHRRDNDLDPAAGSVIATAGGSEALHLALEAHVDPGDEVLVPDPGFVSYEALTHVAGGEPVRVGLRDDLTLDPEAVAEAITDDTVAFVVNSPANPTGAVQSPADMRAFAELADDHDVLCISDEVYEHIIYEGRHASPMAHAETDNVVVVNSCSKAYAMTGWRLGWTLASPARTEPMLKVHQYVQACASAPAQVAAEAALRGPHGALEGMVATFERRRDLLLEGLRDAGLEVPTPTGAFYAFPRVPAGWIEAVLGEGVIVVPGEAFGPAGAGHARISYAASEGDIEAALETFAGAA
ncbi:MAG: pyridoxal phosphate-dependent aminotransferase [Halobacteriales archaeon]